MIMDKVWRQNSDSDFYTKLGKCTRELKMWGEKLGTNFKDRIEQSRGRMIQYRGKRDAFSIQCYDDSLKEYSKLLAQQEDFWKQRAKQHWLKTADCNSKYFHTYASARRKKNLVTRLKDNSGTWQEKNGGLEELVGSYFEGLFQSQGCNLGDVLSSVETRINQEQNDVLTKEFSSDEVREAVFAMHPDKSPGPDGLNPAFYQRFWATIGFDVAMECQRILTTRSLPCNLNDTLVVLIPKKQILNLSPI